MLLLAHVFQTPASICNLIEVVVHQYISPLEPFLFQMVQVMYDYETKEESY